MTEPTPRQLLQFPCQFPIKIVGHTDEAFEKAVYAIINRHVNALPEGALRINTSKGGKYMAATVTINALSQEQLDNIYHELTSCKHVIMAL